MGERLGDGVCDAEFEYIITNPTPIYLHMKNTSNSSSWPAIMAPNEWEILCGEDMEDEEEDEDDLKTMSKLLYLPPHLLSWKTRLEMMGIDIDDLIAEMHSDDGDDPIDEMTLDERGGLLEWFDD